jgi:hypothetical protein
MNETVSAMIQYIAEKIQKAMSLPKFSVWCTWVDMTFEELKVFLGVIMNTVLKSTAQLTDYFSVQCLDRTPFFEEGFCVSHHQGLQSYEVFLVSDFISYFGHCILLLL